MDPYWTVKSWFDPWQKIIKFYAAQSLQFHNPVIAISV